jgi:hypothetical protein
MWQRLMAPKMPSAVRGADDERAARGEAMTEGVLTISFESRS